ncbi:hypothetical protein ABEB36_010928 [Hypothenemus hampei]|uniref:G-protein coupled receptors family 1 profile domain-containing protein n=1 Tax=Hypothenemus hampei TaxID=57062 RepID=A0ABD1EDL4_HYPHA
MSNWREFLVNGCIIGSVFLISIFVYFYSKGTCPFGTMPCNSHGYCVPTKNICNDQKDCPDGEDEDPVLCADFSGSTDFVDGVLNKSLMKRIQSKFDANLCDVDMYPSACQCAYRTRVYCNHAGFLDIPRDISRKVDYLVLQNNTINILRKSSLFPYNLTMLQLENNRLTTVEPGAFKEQRHLNKLFLMSNNLKTLPAGTFEGLSRLEWLHIDKNLLEDIDMSSLEVMKEIKWINMSFNKLTFDYGESFPSLPKLQELYLNNNHLKSITNYTFYNLTGLDLLALKGNLIGTIDSGAFLSLNRLKELDLSSNSLKVLPENVFASQQQLTKLSFGYNPLRSLPEKIFSNLPNLLSLHLEDIEILNIDTKMFGGLDGLKWIYFKTYTYCTFAPEVPRCRPLSDGISSLNQLLYKPIFRYSNWLMCVITIGGNSLVLFGRFLFRDENKNLSIVIKNLAVSDGLMGIYLLSIAYHDLKFRDNYNEMARKWISSWTCVFTGVVGMISLEVSVMFLVFLSVDRYFVITMPYKKYGVLSLKETWRIVFFIWCFGISISVIPVLGFSSSTKFYGVNGLCLPLYINDPYFIGWQYSALIFFGVNASSLIIISYTYARMFINIKNTRKATSVTLNDGQFALRFFFIVFTNVACWLPIILAKMLVYFTVEVSADFYAWLVVFILPINSSLNPILYTFTTRKYREKIVNMPQCLRKCAYQSRPSETQLSREIFTISQRDIEREKYF